MLHGVGQPLACDEVGRGLELLRKALSVRPHLNRQRSAGGQLPESRGEPRVELRRPDSAGELLELAGSDVDLPNRAVDRLAGLLRRVAQLVLRVAQREADRDQPLLGPVVQVALEPPPLLIAGGHDPRARGLDLVELAAQLDAEPCDLDREAGRLDDLLEQSRPPLVDGAVEHHPEREPRARDRRSHATVLRLVAGGPATRIDVELALGQEEAQLEPGVGEHLAEHRLDRLGRGASGAQVLEEAHDPRSRVVASAAEAAVDRVLHPRAQRPEGDRDEQRRHGRRPGRAAAERRAEQQGGRRIGAGEQQGEHAVDERAVDDPVDLVEAVAKHRHADRRRDRPEHEEEEGGEDGPVVAVAVRERPRQADEQRRRNQHGGVGQPLELKALDPGGAPEAHAHGLDSCKQAGEHAEEGERPEQPEHAGEPWQRPVDVLVGRFEGLAVEEAQDEKGRYGRGGGERNAPPPRRGQAAIGKDERDRDQHREQERPGRLIPQHRPLGARESAGLLLQGIRRVGLRDAESRHQKRVPDQQPADRMTWSPHRHQQPDPARGEHDSDPERPLPRRLSVRARQRVQHRPEHAEPHGGSRENPGPRGGPAHGTIVSRGGPTATALPLKRVRC